MVVEIYSKPECPLCEEAKEVVAEVQRRVAFELKVTDITSDPSLYERFKYDIPVVWVDGRRFFTHRVDRSTLERVVRGQ